MEILMEIFSTGVFSPVFISSSSVSLRRMEYLRFAKKVGTSHNFLQVLGVFLSDGRLRPGATFECVITIFKFHMFTLARVTDVAAKTPKKQCERTIRKNPLVTMLSLY